MILSPKQEQGLKVAVERYKYKMKYTCISGYASLDKNFWSNSTKSYYIIFI